MMSKDQLLDHYKNTANDLLSHPYRQVRDLAIFIGFCLRDDLIRQTIKDKLEDPKEIKNES